MTRAATPSSISSDSLVSRISSRFSLNKVDVQGVFDQERDSRMAQQQKDQTARLDKAVTDGTITKAKRDLITAKQIEFRSKIDSLESKDATSRRADIKKLREATKTWEITSKIDVKYLGGGMQGGHSRINKNVTGPMAITPLSTN